MTQVLVFVVTSALSLGLVDEQAEYFSRAGMHVHVVCDLESGPAVLHLRSDVQYHHVALQREISFAQDVRALLALTRLLHELRPDIINYGTPKAGFVGALAALLARVPRRVYTLHGLRLETVTGIKRLLLLACEATACVLSHHVVVASSSLLTLARAAGLPLTGRSSVPGVGSVLGLDSPYSRQQVLARVTAESDAVLFVFVGRLVKDKGVVELLGAFSELVRLRPRVRLELWGPYEEGDPLPSAVRNAIDELPSVTRREWVPDVVRQLHECADVLVLPSHREGFPTTSLEAYAAGVPVIASSATGVVDSVRHERTGLLCEPGDTRSLLAAMLRLVDGPVSRRAFGVAGHAWLSEDFATASRVQHFAGVYAALAQRPRWRRGRVGRGS